MKGKGANTITVLAPPDKLMINNFKCNHILKKTFVLIHLITILTLPVKNQDLNIDLYFTIPLAVSNNKNPK